MDRCALTIVLPAYNEAERIRPALDELFAYLQNAATQPAEIGERLPADVRVLVVDDGSTDDTARLVLARDEAKRTALERARLELLRVPHGGKGAAVHAGMMAADSDLIIFADADMATPPNQLPLLVRALDEADVALGSRIQSDGSDMRESQPLHRRLLGRAFRFLASRWVTGSVQDTQCGFKGFRKAAAHDLFALQRITSIVFDAELIYLARRRGYRLTVVPVRWADRRGSRMHTRPLLAARVAWDLVRIPFLHRRLPSAGPG